jgi:hypothetical protein
LNRRFFYFLEIVNYIPLKVKPFESPGIAGGLPILIIVLVFCALSCVAGALRAEEQERWYLISESELSIIGRYKATSEAEKQSWLLQAASLNQKLRNSEAKSTAHGLTVKRLNSQLAGLRETNRELERSFGALEAGRLSGLSLKNGEIAGLQRTVSERTAETEKYKGRSRSRLAVIFALAGSRIVFIAFRACRFFKLI